MILKAKTIAHGEAMEMYMVNKYIDGVSVAHEVDRNGLFSEPGEGVVEEMELYNMMNTRLQKPYLRLELSPTREESQNMKDEDWRALVREVIGKLQLQKHQYHAVFHAYGNKGGEVPHVHVLVNRVPKEGGPAYSDWQIGKKCINIADEITGSFFHSKRTATSIGVDRRRQIKEGMLKAMQSMPAWDMDTFSEKCRENGVYLSAATSRHGCVSGYRVSLGEDGRQYKLSSLGEKFRPKNIENTWQAERSSLSARTIFSKGHEALKKLNRKATTEEVSEELKELRSRIWAAMRCMPAWDLEAFRDACRCYGVQTATFVPKEGEHKGQVCLRYRLNDTKTYYPFWAINKELSPEKIEAKFKKEKAKALYNKKGKDEATPIKRIRNSRKDHAELDKLEVEFDEHRVAWKGTIYYPSPQEAMNWKDYLQRCAEGYEVTMGIPMTEDALAHKVHLKTEQTAELMKMSERLHNYVLRMNKEKLEAQIENAWRLYPERHGALGLVRAVLANPDNFGNAAVHFLVDMLASLAWSGIKNVFADAIGFSRDMEHCDICCRPYPEDATQQQIERIDAWTAWRVEMHKDLEEIRHSEACPSHVVYDGKTYKLYRECNEYVVRPQNVQYSSKVKERIAEREL